MEESSTIAQSAPVQPGVHLLHGIGETELFSSIGALYSADIFPFQCGSHSQVPLVTLQTPCPLQVSLSPPGHRFAQSTPQ